MPESNAALTADVRAAWEAARKPHSARQGLSLQRIIEAATHVADTDGLNAISMARVANELGFATMSLYRHVASKDALLTHLQSAAIGDPPRQHSAGLPWREGLEVWTRALLASYRRRPWLLRIPVTAPPLMPQSLQWMDWAMEIMTDLPLDPVEKLSTLNLLSGYARNEVTVVTSVEKAAAPESQGREHLDYEAALQELVGPDQLPAIHALISEGNLFDMPAEVTAAEADDFMPDFGLQRILDGIEALISKRAAH